MTRNAFASPATDDAERVDVVVMGAGPAGEAVASACAARGLDTLLVDPAPDRPWVPTYAAWVDELEGLGLDEALAARWPVAEVHTGHSTVTLQRPYAVFDNAALRAALRARSTRLNVLQGRVTAIDHDDDGSFVSVGSVRVRARLVVDASGGASPWVERTAGDAQLHQRAFGRIGVLASDSAQVDGLTWMDLRAPGVAEDVHVPTFLYAMRFPDGRVLLEETSLVRAPAVTFEELEARLDARMRAMGLRFATVEHVERCSIPMDLPLPRVGQRVIAFGTAGGHVHPATGFMVARCLRLAPDLARSVSDAIACGARGDALARTVWAAVWPEDTSSGRDLHLFGMSAAANMTTAETQQFFSAFFDLPAETWRAFLSGPPSVSRVAGAMWSVFALAPWPVRFALLRRGGAAGWRHLAPFLSPRSPRGPLRLLSPEGS